MKLIVSPKISGYHFQMVAASFDAKQRQRAQRVEPSFQPGHLYLGWRQVFASPADEVYTGDKKYKPKYVYAWDINLQTQEARLVCIKKARLVGFYVDPELHPESMPISGSIVGEGADAHVACDDSLIPAFEDGCSPVQVGTSIELDDMDDKQNGKMYIDDTFCFFCYDAKGLYQTRPKQNAKGVWEVANIPVPGQAGMYHIRVSKHTVFRHKPYSKLALESYNDAQASDATKITIPDSDTVQDLIKEFELVIPKFLSDQHLVLNNNGMWDICDDDVKAGLLSKEAYDELCSK